MIAICRITLQAATLKYRRLDGEILFSFWTDPEDHYRMKYCKGAKWQNGVTVMAGFNPASDFDVGVALVNQAQDIRSWSFDS